MPATSEVNLTHRVQLMHLVILVDTSGPKSRSSTARLGSLNLLNSNNISAEKMVETVATRGGTTEAGIKKMKLNKVDNIFNQVFKAAYTRAKQQGEGK